MDSDTESEDEKDKEDQKRLEKDFDDNSDGEDKLVTFNPTIHYSDSSTNKLTN